MTRKTVRKTLSYLLVVAMLLAMIPASSLAAGGTQQVEFFAKFAALTPDEERPAAPSGTVSNKNDDATNRAILDEYMAYSNSQVTLTGQNKITVKRGETFYLAFGANTALLTNGLTAFNIFYNYNSSVFSWLDIGSNGLGDYQEQITNGALSVTTGGVGAENYLKGQYPEYVNGTSQTVDHKTTSTDDWYSLQMTNDASNTYHIPSAAAWYTAQQFKVAENAPLGEYQITFDTNAVVGSSYSALFANQKAGTSGTTTPGDATSVKYQNLTIEIVNPSDDPVNPSDVGEDGTVLALKNSVVNEKNAPYTNKEDTFIVPTELVIAADAAAGTAGFAAGDSVILFEDKNGAAGNKLGSAVLAAGNGDNDGKLVADLIELQTVEGTEKLVRFLPQVGGDVWVARMQPGKSPSELMFKVPVVAEDAYYTEDVAVIKTGKGSSAADPILVPLGATIQDVLDQAGLLPSSIADVAVDYGDKVTVGNLSWNSMDFTGETAAVTPTSIIATHETAGVIKLLFPDAAAGGPAKQGGTDGATNYGAVIYVSVTPNANDYFVKKAAEGNTVTLSGGTLDAFTGGDKITFYTAATGGTGLSITKGTSTSTGDNNEIYELVDDANFTMPAVGESIYVAFTEVDGTETGRVAVVVTDGSYQVSGPVNLNPKDPEKMISVVQGTAVADILAMDVFKDVPVPLSGGYTAKVNMAEGANLSIKLKGTETAYNPATAANLSEYTLTYKIPAGTVTIEGGETINYINTKDYTISANFIVITRIAPAIANDDDNGGGSITKKENNPYPAEDIIELADNEAGGAGLHMGDDIKVYTSAARTGTPIATGKVSAINGLAVTIKLNQIGYTGGKLYLDVVRANTLTPENPIVVDFTGKNEAYVLTGVTAMSTEAIKIAATTADSAETTTASEVLAKLPATTTITYGRYKDNGGVPVLDPATVGTKSVNLTAWSGGAAWAKDKTGTALADGDVRNMSAALLLYGKVDLTTLTAADNTTPVVQTAQVAGLSGDLTVSFRVTSGLVDPSVTAKIANENTTITNNAYPQKDVVTIAGNLAVGETVKIYTQDPTGNSSAVPVASYKATGSVASFEVDQIVSTKSTVYMTIEEADSLPSLPVAKQVAEENYVLYSYSLVNDTAAVKKGTTAADAKNSALPKTITITVAHLAKVGTNYESVNSTTITAPITDWEFVEKKARSTSYLEDNHLANLGDVKVRPVFSTDGLKVGNLAVETADATAGITLTVPTFMLKINELPELPLPDGTDPLNPAFEVNPETVTANINAIVVVNERDTDQDSITIQTVDTELQGATVTVEYIDASNPGVWAKLEGLTFSALAGRAVGEAQKIVIDSTNPAFKGLTSSGAEGGLRITFNKATFNPAIYNANVLAEKSDVAITAIDSGRTLHFVAGDVKNADQLKGYVADKTTATATLAENVTVDGEATNKYTLDIASTGWTLQTGSGNNWTDVAAADVGTTLAVAGSYRLKADVVYQNLGEGAPILAMPEKVIPAVIELTVYATAIASDLKLTVGNHYEWTKKNSEDYKYNMVYYYKYDAFDVEAAYSNVADRAGKLSVKDILQDTAIATINGQSVADFKAAGGTISITEWKADGTEIGNTGAYVGYNNHINPYFSASADDYFVSKVSNGLKRAPEQFYVEYKAVDKDGGMYILRRPVKITYRAGDTNLSGTYTGLVTADIIAFIGGSYYVVAGADAKTPDIAICKLLMDLNGDGDINGLDTAHMISIIGKGDTVENPIPDFRR